MRILSGVQPSGKLHLGNYFGAIRQFIDLQDRGEGYYFIADLHALTTVRDGAKLRESIQDVALDFLALGLDPSRATLFRQSHVPEVCELAWLLSTAAPMAWLQRAHSYKDKVARGISPDVGLFTYPVLMAADILIYDSDLVPVGKDQKQHLEITVDLATKFNITFCPGYDEQTALGGALRLPKPHIVDESAVVPGADGQKMSKSYGNTIDIFAPDKLLKQQVMAIVTDSTPLEAPKNPDTCNVFALLKLFCPPDDLAVIRAKYEAGGYGYGHAKLELLDRIKGKFGAARTLREQLARDLGSVEQVLFEGAQRARAEATRVLDRCKRATGLLPP